MKLRHDPRYNVAYIRLEERPAQVSTVEVGDAMKVDVGPDGTIYGIELLNANEQLNIDDSGILTVVNEADGASYEIPLGPRR